MSEIFDLDILKPSKKIIKLDGKEIDVSFLPCAITFEIDDVMKELKKCPIKEIAKGKEIAKRAFDLAIKECSIFASSQYPEMTEEWFRKNTTTAQIQMFAKLIESALSEAYKGVGEYGKK